MDVIFEADDFGYSFGTVEGVKDAFLDGVASSTSVVVNGDAFKYGLKILKKKLRKIGVGLHLNITDGHFRKSLLTDEGGFYKYNFASLFYFNLFSNEKLLLQIEKDFDAQIRVALDSGLKIDHLNSERHVHMISPIFKIVCKLAKRYKIKCVRITKEPFITPFTNFNLLKWLILRILSRTNERILKRYNLKGSDATYGILFTNNMDEDNLKNILIHAGKRRFKLIEIISHPAYPTDPRDKNYTSKRLSRYLTQKNRLTEMEALKSAKVKTLISELKIRAVSYKTHAI